MILTRRLSFRKGKRMPRVVRNNIETPESPHVVRLQLDSGAFTAYNKGEHIDLRDYIAFIKANRSHIDTYFNLDVIPGEPGQKRDQAMADKGADASYKNLKIMKRAGLQPIPVYHQNEDFRFLHQMIKDKEPYIALSTFKELSVKENQVWLDQCFTILTDEHGIPSCKVHGLGIASFDLLKRYPWFSCDATSWAITAAFGSLFIPIYRAGVPDYSQAPVKITVSTVERKNGMPSDHYLRLSPLMQERVRDFLEKHVGVTIAQVTDDYVSRADAIVYFYLRFAIAVEHVSFRHRGAPLAI